MSDIKISQLPAATLPLSGSELGVLVQSGATVNVPVTNLGTSSFLTANPTSATVLATYPPASSRGLTVNTVDMGIMMCDGVRWNVMTTPPIPAGAATYGYGKNAYTMFPTLADIGFSGSTNGQYKLYSGYASYGSQPNNTAYSTSNGQLQCLYQGAGAQNGLLTLYPYATAPLSQNYGQLLLLLAGRGFHFEFAATSSSNNTDLFNAVFLMPQEHNNEQDDSNPSYPTKYEQWHEFDIWESGHGSDYSGAYRGAYLQWAGRYNWPLTAATSYASGTTAFSLSSPWTGETATNTTWQVFFQSGESRYVNLTNGSVGPYTLYNGLGVATPLTVTNTTTAITIAYARFLNNVNYNTTTIDNTVEHIFGGTYDPIGQTFTSWVDGIQIGQVSTYNANSPNTFRDSLHYGPIIQMASHGAHTASSVNFRYFAAWVP